MGDIQILLAHASSETTKIYTHPNFELASEYINKIPTFKVSIEKMGFKRVAGIGFEPAQAHHSRDCMLSIYVGNITLIHNLDCLK